MIIAHLLPLTKYLGNGQYALVQPIASNFAERCIWTILTTNNGDNSPSTAANEISRQWAVRFSTAHRLEIRRAKVSALFSQQIGLPRECSFTFSKLRFFGLRKPKTTSFYSTSLSEVWSGFEVRVYPELAGIPYSADIMSSNQHLSIPATLCPKVSNCIEVDVRGVTAVLLCMFVTMRCLHLNSIKHAQ